MCPVCMKSIFTYLCQYQKYHYQNQIPIIRVVCQSCGCTHALIPEFSLPGTSIGTAEANKYMNCRQKGISQKVASEVFTSRGMSRKYGIRFEKMMDVANQRAMALFPDGKSILHNPLLLFNSTISSTLVIPFVNSMFLKEGYNPLYFSRRNILRVRENKLGRVVPLNKGAIWSDIEILDSS